MVFGQVRPVETPVGGRWRQTRGQGWWWKGLVNVDGVQGLRFSDALLIRTQVSLKTAVPQGAVVQAVAPVVLLPLPLHEVLSRPGDEEPETSGDVSLTAGRSVEGVVLSGLRSFGYESPPLLAVVSADAGAVRAVRLPLRPLRQVAPPVGALLHEVGIGLVVALPRQVVVVAVLVGPVVVPLAGGPGPRWLGRRRTAFGLAVVGETAAVAASAGAGTLRRPSVLLEGPEGEVSGPPTPTPGPRWAGVLRREVQGAPPPKTTAPVATRRQ